MIFLEQRNFFIAFQVLPGCFNLVVSSWYALKGYLLDILDAPSEIKGKLRKVAQGLGEDYRKMTLGYKTVKEFVDEYVQ